MRWQMRNKIFINIYESSFKTHVNLEQGYFIALNLQCRWRGVLQNQHLKAFSYKHLGHLSLMLMYIQYANTSVENHVHIMLTIIDFTFPTKSSDITADLIFWRTMTLCLCLYILILSLRENLVEFTCQNIILFLRWSIYFSQHEKNQKAHDEKHIHKRD